MSVDSAIARKSLEARFSQIRPVDRFARPYKGWIRAIRDSLGMTTIQLAQRLGVSQPRISAIEKNEVNNSLTLETLMRVAEALDCRFVYALVPNSSLDDLVRQQARKVALESLSQVEQSMRLEDQEVMGAERQSQLEDLIDDLIAHDLRRIW
jgi:predicted DNA-binding mobile mystery protein A